jgi:hypothetical protein
MICETVTVATGVPALVGQGRAGGLCQAIYSSPIRESARVLSEGPCPDQQQKNDQTISKVTVHDEV